MGSILQRKIKRTFTKEDNKDRYRMHKELRALGFEVNTSLRLIFVPLKIKKIPIQMISLSINYGYQIRTRAFIKKTF